MTIRKAVPKDAEPIATFLLLAMEDIVCKFIGQEDYDKARSFLLRFVEKEYNQYSYQNCWVVEVENQVVAAVNIYDGARLEQLRKPVAHYIKTHFLKDFNPENETQTGEYYIDTLGVKPDQQGKGIGAELLRFLIDEYVNQNKNTLGLLVDEENPKAKKLYLKLGFKPVGNKTLVGKNLLHLQFKA